MRRYIFLIVFICVIVATGFMVVNLGRNQTNRFLKSDIERNGIQLQQLMERFYSTLGKGTYPDSIYELFHSGSVWDRDRMRNPYTHDAIHISDTGRISHSPGNLLYAVTKRNDKGRAVAYKIFMLGQKTDPFYDPELAAQWQEEYRKYTSDPKSPDNIVMVFTSRNNE